MELVLIITLTIAVVSLAMNIMMYCFYFTHFKWSFEKSQKQVITVQAATTDRETDIDFTMPPSSIDKTLLKLHSLYLVKNQTNPEDNGIYQCVASDFPDTPFHLTPHIQGGGATLAYVQHGHLNKKQTFFGQQNRIWESPSVDNQTE